LRERSTAAYFGVRIKHTTRIVAMLLKIGMESFLNEKSMGLLTIKPEE
jgi:hypothetical protein